ncbi:MAG: AAA family ATPase [Barrevirus sp.]|uniref:AAA family ATPase n=1 Tax=Barrevirus sp. TaxID=2487763 RepID=A0A3G4ZQ25_9VIRU|nr:MAG: AAA family ATPase [Barrevirus sp.]
MDNFTPFLKFCETHATNNNLIFRTIKYDYDGKVKYIEYIKNEFTFANSYNDFPVLTCPTDYHIKIGERLRSFSFLTNFMVNNDYGSATGTFFIFSESHSDIDDLLNYLDNKYNKNKCMMYIWDIQRCCYVNSDYEISKVSRQNLVGLDTFFLTMKKEIEAIKNHRDIAILLGASSGANYFAYGPPGTGKTSAFKVLGNELNIPVYSVNLSLIPVSQYKFALSPKPNKNSESKVKQDDIMLVIVEDFDRYIKTIKEMSELLNALDGTHNSYGVIRIFSANMPEISLKDRALKSRIKKFIKFDLPTTENMYQHLVNVSNGDFNNAKKLAVLVEPKNLSYRVINNYLSRFITEDSLLGSAVNGFDNWMKEFEEIESLEVKTI